jgi:hypothetical protein
MISSPVETSAIRSRRKTATESSPVEAIAATSWGRNRSPAATTTLPPKILAGLAAVGALVSGRRDDHELPAVLGCASQSSCMATVSAPAGITAPVKIRAADPTRCGAGVGCPAAMRPRPERSRR